MEYLAFFLAQHHIKNVIYFLGGEKRNLLTPECLDFSSFDNFVYAFPNGEQIQSFYKQEKCVSDNELDGYKDHVFVFDHISNADYISKIVSKYKPEMIVGHFSKDFDAFGLWEKCRFNVKKMYIALEIDDNRNSVLKWSSNDNDKPLLSVIFPTFNVEKYLDKCIETVTKWDAPYIEYLFVDDGSTDSSADIIQKWASKDNRIKLFKKSNGGCASAREYGLIRANGKYIGFVDPDDFVDENMFKKLLANALKGMYDISYCGYKEYYENSGTSKDVDDALGWPYSDGVIIPDAIDELIAIRKVAIWRGIYRKEFLVENNIHFNEQLKRFDDLPFKIETLARAKSVISLPERLYYYRLEREGQDVSADDERLFVHFDIFKELDEFFQTNRSSKQIDYYLKAKIQTHYWAISKIKTELLNKYLRRAAADLKIDNGINEWRKTFRKCYNKKDVKLIMRRIGRI